MDEATLREARSKNSTIMVAELKPVSKMSISDGMGHLQTSECRFATPHN